MGHLAGDGAAGVVENIGNCIPRYTILSAMRFLYETDGFMVMIYILIFLGKLISMLFWICKNTLGKHRYG